MSNEKYIEIVDEVDLKKIFLSLWKKKYFIITITSICAVISVYVAINKPNIYKSSALVSVVESSSGGGGVQSSISQYSGLASLAGISLPSSGGVDKTSLAIETIRSRSFFKHLINKNEILPSLMAAEGYDPKSNELTFNDELYDPVLKIWLKDENNISTKPSYLESYEIYRSVVSISKNPDTGYLLISVTSLSPFFAENLLSLILKETNEVTRNKDLLESNKAMEYLVSLSSQTTNTGVKNSINKIIDSQLETQMLANINQDYLLQSLDPPYVPEIKFAPSRSKIAILGTITGCMISMFLVLLQAIYFLPKTTIKPDRE
jgi:hypothetical protein